jgi:hypothetical protein
VWLIRVRRVISCVALRISLEFECDSTKKFRISISNFPQPQRTSSGITLITLITLIRDLVRDAQNILQALVTLLGLLGL